jgi:hypothetical protein
MDEGRLVESGTHAQLLEQSGLCATLVAIPGLMNSATEPRWSAHDAGRLETVYRRPFEDLDPPA